mgnify:CR=1 FL=1|jgi:Predicted metal-dependent hydrolase
MKIQLDNQIIDINVLYGVRKKLAIQMDAMGRITVKAPNDTRDEVIEQAVKQHEQEILKRLQAIAKAQAVPKTRVYQDEGKFLHLGRYYALQELIDTEGLSEEELRLNLRKFYFASCKKVIAERIKPYQTMLKVKPKSIDIVESATKWGSCSSSKKLTFNYRLAMAPLEVIDYVIIHELCHLTHMNHDRSFWRLLGSIMPDYKDKEAYLARHGQAMTL